MALVVGGGSKNLNSVLLPLPVDPAGEPGVEVLVECGLSWPATGVMTPFVCGGSLPRPLSWVLDGKALAREAVFVVEFLRDRTPMTAIGWVRT